MYVEIALLLLTIYFKTNLRVCVEKFQLDFLVYTHSFQIKNV